MYYYPTSAISWSGGSVFPVYSVFVIQMYGLLLSVRTGSYSPNSIIGTFVVSLPWFQFHGAYDTNELQYIRSINTIVTQL